MVTETWHVGLWILFLSLAFDIVAVAGFFFNICLFKARTDQMCERRCGGMKPGAVSLQLRANDCG